MGRVPPASGRVIRYKSFPTLPTAVLGLGGWVFKLYTAASGLSPEGTTTIPLAKEELPQRHEGFQKQKSLFKLFSCVIQDQLPSQFYPRVYRRHL